MNESLIEQLVQARGIESEYTDAWGNQAIIEQASKEKILSAMGYPVDDEVALIEKVNEETKASWLTVIEPANVIRIGQKKPLYIKLPIDFVNDELTLIVKQDEKLIQKVTFTPIEHQLVASNEINEIEIQLYEIDISFDLEMGYFDIALLEEGQD